MGLVVRRTEGARLFYQSGSKWYRIPGISNFSVSGGDAPVTEDVAFEGSARSTGELRPQSVECKGFYTPDHPSWDALVDAAEAKQRFTFRFEIPSKHVWPPTTDSDGVDTGTGITLAITDAGVATFVGAKAPDPADSSYGPGQSFKLGSTMVPISRVDHGADGDTAILKAKAGFFVRADSVSESISASVYRIQLPTLQRTFIAEVANVDADQADTESSMTTPLVLSPLVRLPKWKAVSSATAEA